MTTTSTSESFTLPGDILPTSGLPPPPLDSDLAKSNPAGEELEPVGTRSRAGAARQAANEVPLTKDLLRLADLIVGRKTAGSAAIGM